MKLKLIGGNKKKNLYYHVTCNRVVFYTRNKSPNKNKQSKKELISIQNLLKKIDYIKFKD